MRKAILVALTALMGFTATYAQRFTDNLDRGLVAVNTGSSTFLSWRMQAEESFGVTYNVYRNGTQVASGLTVTNYSDPSTGGTYSVAAVVGGVEQGKCAAVSAWGTGSGAGMLDIALAKVYDRDGNDVTANYSNNDAEFADLDGDGQLEMVIKRLNTVDASANSDGVIYARSSKQFVVFDAYDINWQTGAATLLWRLDCGPNMMSLNSTEINLIAYDWDEDGKAECVLRGADNMVVYGSDGKTKKYTIGVAGANYRVDNTSNSQFRWTIEGPEYLVYMNGQTGALYQQIEYPLKRLESGETSLDAAWGDGYGHRSTKHFMGAPFLDGRKASLFLARGIYTRHKMIAMDLNRSTHLWSERWRWNCNDSKSAWYGNGYHNFVVADVDEDGRDEIVYGSMVIDDNGKGLSTTGYGHGDSQHVSDFDPWRKGLEFLGCLEEAKGGYGFNYRNATTSEIYRKVDASGDDGRCIAGNFVDAYPGSMGRSSSHGIISLVTDEDLTDISNLIAWGDCNFRIYWDGDLCSEILNSPGTAKEAKIDKPGKGRIFTSSGCNMNNDSKNNPCFQGDLFGDWREEIVVRCGQNVRVYTTVTPTAYAMPSLWYDHEYRQAMVWQMMAYNQPPHLSYFLGENEGYTVAPPPLTMRGKTELAAGASFGTEMDGKDLLFCPQQDKATLTFNGKPAPRSLTINTPTWVQGNDDNNKITTTTYTHSLESGGSDAGFQGAMRLVKQGDGTLILPKKTLNHTGPTEIWGGTVQMRGTLNNSKVWMNRHTTMNTTYNCKMNGGLEMLYGATLNVGGATASALDNVTVTDLTLDYGARVVMYVNSTTKNKTAVDAGKNDLLTLTNLTAKYKEWENGPKYSQPVFEIVTDASTLEDGRYPIGTLTGTVTDIDHIAIECSAINVSRDAHLTVDGGILYLEIDGIKAMPEPDIVLTGLNEVDLSMLYPSTADGKYYLPVVSIVSKSLELSASNIINSTLSGTFTALDGTVTNVGNEKDVTLMSEDYNDATDASSWITNANLSLDKKSSNDQYISLKQGGGSGSRYFYHDINASDLSSLTKYVIDFDAKISMCVGNFHDSELLLYTSGISNDTKKSYTWQGSNDYIFKIAGGKNWGTTYTSAYGEKTFTLANDSWYHFSLQVDKKTRNVTYTTSNADGEVIVSDSYTLPNAVADLDVKGLFVSLGRANSTAGIDNIHIYEPASDMTQYAFTQPGTLTVTASADKAKSSVKTFTFNNPYLLLYESKDYNKIKAANAAATLGSDYWEETTSTTRFANWSKTNPTYNDSYVVAKNKVNSNSQTMYVDKDKKLWVDFKKSDCPLYLIQDFGVGQNVASTFHATDLVNDNTLIYLRYDVSYGNGNATEMLDYADKQGNYEYTLSTNGTLQKFAAYIPITINDEKATVQPGSITNGNAQLWRSSLTSLTGADTWATLVLPFNLTLKQVREVFGDGTEVANLLTDRGASDYMVFEFADETDDDGRDAIAVTANVPFLIRGVTKESPYLFLGVNSMPTERPMAETSDFQFIGTYVNAGSQLFTSADYFYMTGGLSAPQPGQEVYLTLQGYRGYFHSLNGNVGSSVFVSFDGENAIRKLLPTPQVSTDVYNTAGQMVKRNARNLDGLKPGIYVVNGKKILVK